ncbi:alpha/beta fold hydrolase [Kribbella sandramycini]|uniref:Alpha/beta fold hydrolase n=1 Tax=Kribbella sandramycini TaxID=60450 RepID=A0A7Y4P366_9ACTN|nr:alpha/beta hydrolase [Kribbella sandramycini]MBB6566760.1 pimeloyl-ACP methyl ester carboxylesterase [Kribbella sandramycini]NOL45546.1 alpha/beta fold hydrolase [Kribbella sandramycini]
MRYRLPVVAAATLALIAPVAPATATAAAAPAPSSLVFGACPADIATPYPALTCATLQVPVDYRRPQGPTLELLITKHAAKDPAKRLGSLLVNPGGPGGYGSFLAGSLTRPDATGFTRLQPAVLDAYDVIGFDPRGVGHSTPISCVEPTYFPTPQPDPDAPSSRGPLWKLWSGFADGCGTKSGALIPHLGTANVARDMDRIRAALGDQKLNYVGFSYGTYLGTVYGELFRHRVGRMILDGNIDPTPKDVWYQAGLAQAPGIQKRFDSYLGWVAKYDSVFHLGSTVDAVRANWNKTLTDFRTRPHGAVGGHELLSLAGGVMFSESNWIAFTRALSSYVVNGDDADLVDFAAPDTSVEGEQSNAIFNAVICADSRWPATKAGYERDAARLAKTSQFAWDGIWANGSACRDWPTGPQNPLHISGRGLPGILLFNTVGDPSTPYAGALKLHKVLKGSVLVTEKDSGKHCVFSNSRLLVNTAANDIGTKYLLTGELPAGDVTIPGHALPVPTPAALRAPMAKVSLLDG